MYARFMKDSSEKGKMQELEGGVRKENEAFAITTLMAEETEERENGKWGEREKGV